MAWFKLLVGQHEGADPDWTPSELDKENAKLTGRPLRAPTKKYVAGDLVYSETDLVAKCGSDKFQYVQGKVRSSPARDKSRFPAGQVSTGTPVNQNPGGSIAPGGGPLDDKKFTESFGDEETDADFDTDRSPESAERGEPEGSLEERWGNLDEMTASDLRELAQSEEIELHGATKKADLLAAIRKSGK